MPINVEEEAQGSGKNLLLNSLFRGGTEPTAPRPIVDPGQSITIHAVSDGHFADLFLETPSLAKEFL